MKRFIAFLIIIAAGLFIQSSYINEFPTHIHAWAEQDHYALTLGFIDNGFDFFHPQTFIYNKQFPGWWKEAYDTTITPAGFPVHEFNAALLMKLFGTTAPWVFRSWTMLWGLLGLFFLFKTSFRITEDWFKSLLVSCFAMTSPIVAYYLNGFLPGIPAVSLNIIGLWYYMCYLDDNKIKNFHLGIAFLTLAMLIRTTFAIGLIAVLCFELLRVFRKESKIVDKLPSVITAAVVFLACQLWNSHLTQVHGTVFLNKLLPAENLEEAKELLTFAWDYWKYGYFQRIQYILIIALILGALLSLFFKEKREKSTAKRPLSLWWLPMIQLFGCLLFTIAMMKQIKRHDYYFIDTFFLPLILVVTLLLGALPKPKNKIVFGTQLFVVVALCILMVRNVTQTQIERRDPNDGAVYTYNNYKDSDILLDSLGIARNAKVLCLYAYPQNGPFILMQRKGFIIMNDNDDLVNAAFTWDFDCMVIENHKYSEYFEKRADLFSQLKLLGGNDKISVFLRP